MHEVCDKKTRQFEVEPEWFIALVLSTGHLESSIDNTKWLLHYLPNIEVSTAENIYEILGDFDNKRVEYHFDRFNKCENIFNSVQHSINYNPKSFEKAIDYLAKNLINDKKIVW